MGSRSTRPQSGRYGGPDSAQSSPGSAGRPRRSSGSEAGGSAYSDRSRRHPRHAGPTGSPMAVVGHSCYLHHRRDSGRMLQRSDSRWSIETEDRFAMTRLVNQQQDSSPSTPVQRALRALTIPLERLHIMKGHMMQAMRRGLCRHTHSRATLKMLPTYICATPDGTEKGDFLVVELCQNQVRTLLVTLLGDGNLNPQMMYKTFDMPEDIMRGEGEALFDFIAQCVSQFLGDANSSLEHLPLGFVFPFSCRQTQLNKAELISWSKGFSCRDVVGKDVVQLLQSAINKQELSNVEVVALMNDTVGTMMTCSTEGRPCEVALIADKGSNCCFMAEAHLVETAEETSGRMCINTEWGRFGDDGILSDILTPYDECVDEESSSPGEKRFEKMVGSLYLGEITRHVLIALAAEKALFTGSSVAVLKEKGVLKTHQVLEIINIEEGTAMTKRALEALGLQPNERDCSRVQQICRAVVSRAATLYATGLSAVLSYMCQSRDMDQLLVNVGVDGELYQGHTRFEEILLSVTKLLAPECVPTLLPSTDGSGRGAAMVTAVAVRLEAQRREVAEVLAPLRLSHDDLVQVQALMRQEMELGLGQETHANASVRMLPTYVCHTPDGTELGEFLALDLGGTNFRVLVVQVTEQGIRMASEIYVIPTAVMQGTGEELFDHIIDCIMDFQEKQDLMTHTLPLGFTFSFPCQQVGLDKALLLTWTKGFSASGCVGQDVVQLLREAAERKHHAGLKVVALVNDTVGTMMSCGYEDPKCEIGLIVGTGTNACYMEEMRNVGTVEGDEGRMCINMEWGAFGDNGCLDHIFTSFDRVVDDQTINPGKQRFEKLISGMYLGEIVRHILLAMADKELLFHGNPSPKLYTKDIFKTKFLSTIELNGLAPRQIRQILQDLELDASFEDSVLMREVCHTVSMRAAQLCAAGLAAVVEKMRENRGLDKLSITVGVDGTLYKLHPNFSHCLQKTLRNLAPNCTVSFMPSEDGSGKGAALVAAVACRVTGPGQ
ncbi:hexokinase-3 isoform X3 [Myiozetetes cayanensis]|uniref:hexokinase-3 isoform X3 n=3 Tax=Myiozetetes cayanensis TaxID=478635 RepID=UPI00215EF0EA|nr:hexokinase-3 isoform X3 [Myiozetetes cayanensis]